jgi:hypothetical protein
MSIKLDYNSGSYNDSSEDDSMNTPKKGGAPAKVTKAIYDKLGIVKEEESSVTPTKPRTPHARVRVKKENDDIKHHYSSSEFLDETPKLIKLTSIHKRGKEPKQKSLRDMRYKVPTQSLGV